MFAYPAGVATAGAVVSPASAAILQLAECQVPGAEIAAMVFAGLLHCGAREDAGQGLYADEPGAPALY